MKKALLLVIVIIFVLYLNISKNTLNDNIPKSSIINTKPIIEHPKERVKKTISVLLCPKSPYFTLQNNNIIPILSYNRQPALTKDLFFKAKIIKKIDDSYSLISIDGSTEILIVKNSSLINIDN